MPCNDPSHEHVWPSEGILTLDKCEKFCGYCTDAGRDHVWQYTWFLRRHIRTVHVKDGAGDYPHVEVAPATAATDRSGADRTSPRKTPQAKRSATEQPGSDGVASANKVTKPSTRRKHRMAMANLVTETNTVTPTAVMTNESFPDHILSPSDDSACAVGQHSDQDKPLYAEQILDATFDDPQQNWTAPFVPESPATHLKMAFRSAVKDLIDQGTSGGIAVLDVAVIMADEADRATLDSVEGSPYHVPQIELMQM